MLVGAVGAILSTLGTGVGFGVTVGFGVGVGVGVGATVGLGVGVGVRDGVVVTVGFAVGVGVLCVFAMFGYRLVIASQAKLLAVPSTH